MWRNSQDISDERLALRVSQNSILLNTLLAAFKLFAGIFARSGAMVADAVHSISDILSTVLVIIDLKLLRRGQDQERRKKQERQENIAAIALAAALGVAGVWLGAVGVRRVLFGDYRALSAPGLLALVAAVVSVVVKEGMYWYTRRAAVKTRSDALMDDAWHHRSDAFSSVACFLGILGARLGFPVLELITSVIICVFIVKAAADILIDAVQKMTDLPCDKKTVDALSGITARQEGVLGIDSLAARATGGRIYVDVTVCVAGTATLQEANRIAGRVRGALESGEPRVWHCMVQVTPAAEEQEDEA